MTSFEKKKYKVKTSAIKEKINQTRTLDLDFKITEKNI